MNGNYVLEASGVKETTYSALAREDARLNDPNTTLTLESGEKVTWNQIPSTIKAYGKDCRISLK